VRRAALQKILSQVLFQQVLLENVADAHFLWHLFLIPQTDMCRCELVTNTRVFVFWTAQKRERPFEVFVTSQKGRSFCADRPQLCEIKFCRSQLCDGCKSCTRV